MDDLDELGMTLADGLQQQHTPWRPPQIEALLVGGTDRLNQAAFQLPAKSALPP